jgi:2-polyprenyl-3-methyl-5-hydroxy-6-metoxy-1,4-benzoquinol methylase
MERESLLLRRDQIIADHGVWSAHNTHLGQQVYTIDRDCRHGSGLLARAVLQIVADTAGRPIPELRVLDLACLEGLYGLEMALHGAEVVGLEIREGHLAKAKFAAEALGLGRMSFQL